MHYEGSGVLYLDRSGRPVVVTARSLVDGSFVERDAFGGDPEIADEHLNVMLPSGTVLHAGRVWVDPDGIDLAALVLTETPPELAGTPADHLFFGDAAALEPPVSLRRAGPDGAAVPAEAFDAGSPQPLTELAGAAVIAGGKVFAIYGHVTAQSAEPRAVPLALLPTDLRPE